MGKRNKAKAEPATASVDQVPASTAPPQLEGEAAAPMDLAAILDWPVRQWLEQSGVSLENIEAQFRAYAANHPDTAPLAQIALNFVQSELGSSQISAAIGLLTRGLTSAMFSGRGPVSHSGCELV